MPIPAKSIQIYASLENGLLQDPNIEYIMLYYIGSPYRGERAGQRAHPLIDLYFLCKLKDIEGNTQKYKMIKHVESWSSLWLHKVGFAVNAEKQSRPFETLFPGKGLSKMIKKDHLKFKDASLCGFLTFKEVVNHFPLYEKGKDILLQENKNHGDLFVAMKSINGYDVIIPCVEIVEFFYMHSVSDTLRKNLLKPGGFGNIANDAARKDYDDGTFECLLDLRGGSESKDSKKIAYFALDDGFRSMYNGVYIDWLKTKKIKAAIPARGALSIYARYFARGNAVMVLNVLAADNFAKFNPRNIDCLHPSGRKVGPQENGGGEDPDDDERGERPKSKKKRKRPKTDNSMDTTEKTDSLSESFYIDIEYPNVYDEQEPDIEIISMEDIDREQSEKEYQYPKEEKPLSTNPKTGSSGEAVGAIPQKKWEKHFKKHKKSFGGFDEIAEIFIGEGYEAVYDSYYFRENTEGIMVDGVAHNGQALIRGTTRFGKSVNYPRQYYVLKAWNEEMSFFMVDVEPKGTRTVLKDGKSIEVPATKEILLISSCEDFAEFVDNVIDEVVFQQVVYDNHAWLAKGCDSLIDKSDCTTIKHKDTNKGLCDLAIKKIRKLIQKAS